MEEANNHFSARASNTAVADGLLEQRESALAGRERHLEATLAQPQGQPQERKARISALEAATRPDGDAPGQRGVPSSRRGPPDAPAHGSEDGATTPSHHERLMAGRAAAPTIPQPNPTGERRRVSSHTSLGNLGRPRFPHSVTSPSRSPASEEASGSNEEDLGFLEFDVTTWVPRSWNGGLLGILFEIRGAYDYWHRGDAHAQIAFDILFSWMRALQLYREPNKQFMDLGRIVLQVFWMQIMIKSDPSIPIQKLRARLHTAFHEDDTFARVAQPFMDRMGTRPQQQRSLRCQLCPIYGHEASTCNVRSKRGFPNYKQTSKNGEGAVHRL
ncbi:hypothetical protein TcYC6_0060670 [Trypanosoma cruzi]|nr:hypothetical protein TcYC6_0060670 [Trypanosoma cruzi]